MNLSDFSLLKEDNENYTIGHPKGKSIQVSKSGLSDKAQKLISGLKREQEFSEGTPEGISSSSDDDRFAKEQASLPTSPEPGSQLPPPTVPNEQPPVAPPQGMNASAELGANQNLGQTAPQASPSGLDQIGNTYANAPVQQAEQAIRKGASAEAGAAKSEADIYQNAAQDVQKVQNDFNQRLTDYNTKDATFAQQLQNNKIDPDRYWHNMSTGSKISSALGIIIGGIGSGLTHTPNAGLAMINKSIDNDISQQMNEQNKSMNLWKMNREALGNDRAATLATQNQMLNIAKVKAMSAQSLAQGDIAKARIAPTILALDQQIQNNNRMRATFDLANTPAGGQGLNKVDPAQLVESLVPKEHQQKVYDEIQAAQDTKRMSNSIMESFDQAAKDNTVMRTGGGYLRTPGSVYALHQSMQPTFKDLEGTVRQAAMENTFKNITPAPGDLDSTIQTKRQALQDYLKSKASAPVAKGNHIDLSKFETTAPSEGGKFAPGSIVAVKGRGSFRVGPDGNILQPL